MKNWFHKFIYAATVVTVLWSCEKDEIKAVMKTGTVPMPTLSSQTVVLIKENADKDALTVSWPQPDYGFDAPAAYTVLIDKKGGDFSNATAITTGTELKKVFKTSELNPILLKMGLKPATVGDIDIKVQSFLGGSTTLNSAVMSVKVTPYLDKLDLSTNWGVVGSATPNGWNGPDVPFYKTDKANVFVAYVGLLEGEIKFRQDNKWDVNYGDTGANGTLEAGGDNIKVKAGTYKITFDAAAFTYSIDKLSWGLVGSATPNGWNAPDVALNYDPSSDQWRAIATLKDGEIKIRQNEAWDLNYGDKGADGTLEAGGDNIAVKAGIYLITVDFKSLKYTIEPYKVWGLVGSGAPNGWDGPDAFFMPDFGSEGIWKLNNITLKDGEIKFRQNNDWGVNMGDDKADGVLEAGGANIVVKAGTYDIVLDFSVASKPIYKLTKK